MRWTPGGRANIEDRRGMRGGGGGGFRMGGGMGLGGLAIILVLSLLTGRNLFQDSGPVAAPSQQEAGGAVQSTPEEEQLVDYVAFVLNDTHGVWQQLAPRMGMQYQDAPLVLFRDVVQSGCGNAQSAMGPFYCPLDNKVYLDLAFFEELRRRFGAEGDFAQAYVIAHEVGHHVQTLEGTSARVRELQERRPDAANQLSVRMELQADCYAGVWAYSTNQRRLLQEGDVDEALAAASAVGDDRLQSQARGSINPESFTHGTAAQRSEWFKRGFASGDPRSCDTFQGAI